MEALHSLSEAETLVAELKKRMPGVAQAYKASGKLTASGLLFMVAGSVLLAPLSPLTGWIVKVSWTAGRWATASLTHDSIGAAGGLLHWLLSAIFGLAVYGGGFFVLTFVIGGFIPAGVGFLGVLGKNRNAWAAGCAGLISVVLGITCLAVCLGRLGVDVSELSPFKVWGGLAACFVGGGVALVFGFCMPFNMTRQWKFCEDCGISYRVADLPLLDADSCQELGGALSQRNFGVALSLLCKPEGEREPGSGGCVASPLLFVCPGCGCGFIDVWMQVAVGWVDVANKTHGEVKKSWLTASQELSPEEVAMFRDRAPEKDLRSQVGDVWEHALDSLLPPGMAEAKATR